MKKFLLSLALTGGALAQNYVATVNAGQTQCVVNRETNARGQVYLQSRCYNITNGVYTRILNLTLDTQVGIWYAEGILCVVNRVAPPPPATVATNVHLQCSGEGPTGATVLYDKIIPPAPGVIVALPPSTQTLAQKKQAISSMVNNAKSLVEIKP